MYRCYVTWKWSIVANKLKFKQVLDYLHISSTFKGPCVLILHTLKKNSDVMATKVCQHSLCTSCLIKYFNEPEDLVHMQATLKSTV